MNLRENSRLQVLASIDRGEITVQEAANILTLCVRQVKRLLSGYRKQGALALAHGNRGRVPVNALPDDIRTRILELLTTDYLDFNNQHVASMLQRKHDITVSRMSVSRIRRDAGLTTPVRRRSRRMHQRRERMAQFGMILQIDGSKHAWFEQRAPECCLIGAVDDATGAIVAAVFCEQECLFGYMRLIEQVLRKYGIPVSVYSDRHTIHVSPKDTPALEQQLAGLNSTTQFSQCLSTLGISQLIAWSPQAKGRIERLFGTLQDRLVKEMRLGCISTIKAANEWLPNFLNEYNQEFAEPPKNHVAAFRAVPTDLNWDYVFSTHESRRVRADNTLSYQGLDLQIPCSATSRSYAKANVEVCTLTDGRIAIAYKSVFIAGPCEPAKLLAAPRHPKPRQHAPVPDKTGSRQRKVHKPSSNHPWRQPLKPQALRAKVHATEAHN
jgi:transposase